MPYHCYIDVHDPVLAGDSRKITKSRAMLDTPNLPYSHAREVPRAPQMPTKGMPSKPTQWVCPCHLVIPHLTLQV